MPEMILRRFSAVAAALMSSLAIRIGSSWKGKCRSNTDWLEWALWAEPLLTYRLKVRHFEFRLEGVICVTVVEDTSRSVLLRRRWSAVWGLKFPFVDTQNVKLVPVVPAAFPSRSGRVYASWVLTVAVKELIIHKGFPNSLWNYPVALTLFDVHNTTRPLNNSPK